MSGCMSPVARRKSAVDAQRRSMAAATAKSPRGVEMEREVIYGSIIRSAVPATGRVKQALARATADHCATEDAKMRRATLQQAKRKAKIDARWVAISR